MPMVTRGRLVPLVNAADAILHGVKDSDGRVVKQYEIPPRAAYWLGRILDRLMPEAERFVRDQNALVGRYGEGEPPALSAESPKWSEFKALLDELNAETVECRFTVKLADLGDAPIHGALIAALGDVVVAE